MATTGFIFSNFRENFDKWSGVIRDNSTEEELSVDLRQYHWYLERYAKQEGGGATVSRQIMGYEGDISEIDCLYMGQQVNLYELISLSDDGSLSDGSGRLESRNVIYTPTNEAGLYTITESWEGVGNIWFLDLSDGPSGTWKGVADNDYSVVN